MRLQQDIIKINGKKIFINPFLYSRKIDQKAKKWLRESGQISQSRIDLNRSKFYPELDWNILSFNEKLLKNTTIELFLKTIEIINIFHPNLNAEQLLLVEEKLIYYKKSSFEKWSKNYILKKNKLILKEKNKLEKAHINNDWQKWLSLKETKKLMLFFFVIMIISAFIGWFAGISKNSCNPYFEISSSDPL